MSESKEIDLEEDVEEIQEDKKNDENINLIDSNELSDLGIDFDGFRRNKSIGVLRNFSHGGLRLSVILLLNVGIFIYEKLVRETNIGHVLIVVFIYDAIVLLEAMLHLILMFICKSKCFNRT